MCINISSVISHELSSHSNMSQMKDYERLVFKLKT